LTKTMPRVGLDVHAHQTHLCNLDLATGEVERKRIGGPPETALAHLEAIGPQLVAVYRPAPRASGWLVLQPIADSTSASLLRG
jgi:hypothetical protein